MLVNGRPDAGLPADDRGCLYGDGVFRTLRVSAGRPLWWAEHLARLHDDAARLGIPCPDEQAWRGDLDTLLGPDTDGALRLMLTRGGGPRGYRPLADRAPNRVASLTPLPRRPPVARLRVCALRLGEQPRLAGIKHLNRLEQVLARGEWDDPEIDEGLLLAADGRVVSALAANVFVLASGVLFTPRLDRNGVAGVTRDRVMRAAARLGVPVRETDFGLDRVRMADEVMLTNSLVGVWPVAWLEDRFWTDHSFSRALGALLDEV